MPTRDPALSAFHNRIRLLHSIDMHELVNAGVLEIGDRTGWRDFRTNPCQWFIRASDDYAEKVWTIMEARGS